MRSAAAHIPDPFLRQLRSTDIQTGKDQTLTRLISEKVSIGESDGRWFPGRIVPHGTLDDRNDGVVITFAAGTVAKTL